MAVETFINVRPYQTRVACAENGILRQIFHHRKQSPSLVGALYKGRVSKITRNLNFAFVDLGLERSGFLYGKDLKGIEKNVSRALRPGQEILVQVKADSRGSKGVRLSMEVGLAGLYLVWLPGQKTKSALSRQIDSESERRRLSQIVKEFNQQAGALLVRTFAQDRSKEELQRDLNHLQKEWKDIQQKFKDQKGPGQILQGEAPLIGFLRDSLSLQPERFVVDEIQTYKKVTKWLKTFRPDLAGKVEHYKGNAALLEHFNLEFQAQKAQQQKVPLKNGGFLIFEELEAFSVIDVNSGRFAGRKNLSQSLVQLNLEAARVIAEQVRLRDLGGIILVDFVDMESPDGGKKVTACLERGFAGDKSHPRVFPMGELGMVQITRKRQGNSLSHFMTKVCPLCHGLGRRKTLSSITADLFLKAENFSPSGWRLPGKKQKLKILCHTDIKRHIESEESETLEFFSKKLAVQMVLEGDQRLKVENFRIEKL